MDADHSSDAAACFGSRLRAKREARGLDLESCAHALKLPARVLRQLENNQLGELDHAIYLGSYISKYARFLGLDEASIQAQLQFIANTPPTLVATGGISHSRYLLERYTTAATYVVLTAVIMVPMIWLGGILIGLGGLLALIGRVASDLRRIVARDKIEAPQFHMFYGFVAIIAVGILYSYRNDKFLRGKVYLLYGCGGLFLMGLAIRAMLQA